MQFLPGDPLLTSVFARRGPFVTISLDASRPPGSGAGVVDQRWGVLRDELIATGSDADSLDAVEEVLPMGVPVGHSYGLVVVAAGGEVCLRERLDPPPERSVGSYSPLPNLLPFLASRLPEVAHLLLTSSAGRTRILQVKGGELDLLWPTDGADRLDLDGVGRIVARFASRLSPDLVMVAGDPESCSAILAELHRRLVAGVIVRFIGASVDDEALLLAAGDATREHGRQARDELLERVQRLSRDRKRVASGARDVAAALRMAQVDAVVLTDGPGMARRCWVGPRPTEFGMRDAEASAVGLQSVRHDRIGSALVRAAVATGAHLLLSRPGEFAPPQDVAGLLR